jgi:hypothetical protein
MLYRWDVDPRIGPAAEIEAVIAPYASRHSLESSPDLVLGLYRPHYVDAFASCKIFYPIACGVGYPILASASLAIAIDGSFRCPVKTSS